MSSGEDSHLTVESLSSTPGQGIRSHKLHSVAKRKEMKNLILKENTGRNEAD